MLPGLRRKRLQLQRKHLQSRLAEAFEQLRKFGYRVFHDLKREGYQLDHVIVGPTGVFAIEKNSLNSAGENGARANRIIKKNCEFDGWIWPLVVITGEWRIKNDLQTAAARLFTTDNLVNHIVNQPSRLTSTEVTLIASGLERSPKVMVTLKAEEPEERF
jgi:hypothetical protein